MPHYLTQRPTFSHGREPVLLARRAFLRSGSALGLALATRAIGRPTPVQAALTIQVAAPQIAHTDDCLVLVSVAVMFTEIASERRFLLYGDVLEAETKPDDAEFCCTLREQHVFLTPGLVSHLTLTQQTTAVALGLVKGMGPAENEAFSPDLVELSARIWLRDLATEDVFGPWDSPERIAVSRAPRTWMSLANQPGNPLMTPRSTVSITSETREKPPRPLLSPSCVS